ncbi:MAG TPA: glycosyltransferase family A protein [Candidatus Limnocylindrales bacterium]|nr:glycosyltransferase family A protein [Candidatus Limnocylindrales bacterium]
MISVVIPAYNEEEHIGKCIESLIHQRISQDYEVIVVDNSSTDRTFEIASKYKNRLNLKVLKEPKKGRGQARFTGCRAAKGEIIMSLDGDSMAPVDWIEKLIKPLSNPKIVAVTGTGKITDCSRRINITFNIAQPLSMVAYSMIFRHYWLTGFNFAIRSEIYKKAGEFDPKINSNEDTDLAFRVAKFGKIKFIRYPVIVSGRRVKKGFVKGVMPYITGYIKHHALKLPPYLSDPR